MVSRARGKWCSDWLSLHVLRLLFLMAAHSKRADTMQYLQSELFDDAMAFLDAECKKDRSRKRMQAGRQMHDVCLSSVGFGYRPAASVDNPQCVSLVSSLCPPSPATLSQLASIQTLQRQSIEASEASIPRPSFAHPAMSIPTGTSILNQGHAHVLSTNVAFNQPTQAGAAGGMLAPGNPDRFRVRKTRTQLDVKAVVRLFLSKRGTKMKLSTLSNSLAAEYGLTSKAVRDIWNLRTWRRSDCVQVHVCYALSLFICSRHECFISSVMITTYFACPAGS